MKNYTKIIVYFSCFFIFSCANINYEQEINEKQEKNDMKGFVINIEKATTDNNFYRKVLYTAKHSQLVLMSLAPNEDIGEEVHHLDQFFRVEAGEGKAILNNMEHKISDGSALVIPAGVG